MIVLMNRNANNGRGLAKWERSRAELEAKCLGRDYRIVSEAEDLDRCLDGPPGPGDGVYVAAGGDGTVNFLLNRIMSRDPGGSARPILGAIGLGSSNDFQKPFAEERTASPHVPFRLDYARAVGHNVGQADFEDETGRARRRYFIINCSLGVIAQANYRFNVGDQVIDRLKSRWVNGTIWYVALKTLLSAPNLPIRMSVGGDRVSTDMTCLSVLINPHVSGSFCYDLPVSGQSPYFGVALCERMGVAERLRTIVSLTRSRFRGLPKTRTWQADRIEIDPSEPTPLELDGEVCLARKIEIRLLPGAIRVCPC